MPNFTIINRISGGSFLVWCTLLPSLDHARESPVFLLNGNEWFFQFVLREFIHSRKWVYMIFLYIKNKKTEVKPCSVSAEVRFKNEQALRLDKGFFHPLEHFYVWYDYVDKWHSKLPSDSLDENWIKFVFHFHDIDGPLTEISNETEDNAGTYRNADLFEGNLSQSFSELLDSGDNCDVEIQCENDTIKAHKIVLSARSKVFKKMLHSEMKESQTGIVQCEDMDVSCLKDFVRYMYTDILPELNFEKAKTLYQAGDKYEIKNLMLRCSDYLQNNLTPENVYDCLVLADMHSDEKLRHTSVTYVLKQKIYLQEECWLPFCENYPRIANEIYRLSYKNIF